MKSLLRNYRYLAKIGQTLFSIFYRNTIMCSCLVHGHILKINLMEKRMAHSTPLPFTINKYTSKTLEDHCIERILGLFVNIHHYTVIIIQKQNRYRYTINMQLKVLFWRNRTEFSEYKWKICCYNQYITASYMTYNFFLLK